MAQRITLILLVTVVCTQTIAGGWFVPGSTDDAYTGTTFGIELIDSHVTVDANGDMTDRQLLGVTALRASLPTVVLVGELRHVLNFRRCEQTILLRVAMCSMPPETAGYVCTYLPLSAELYKGPVACEL